MFTWCLWPPKPFFHACCLIPRFSLRLISLLLESVFKEVLVCWLVLMKNFKHTQNRRMNSHVAIMQIEQLLRLCHVCFNCFSSFFWSILKQIHKISSHFPPNTYAYISKTIDIFLNNSMSLLQLTIRINNSLVSSSTPLYSEFSQFSQKIFSPTSCLLPP